MKKVFYSLWIVASIVSLVMCSKSSPLEEKALTESVKEASKAIVVDPEAVEAELVEMVNEHRASIGASELVLSPSSYEHAEAHNNYMISKNKLSHDNFQTRASEIASETGAVEVGENVARFYSSADSALEGWLNSTSHKRTLEGDFTHTTLSIQLDQEGRAYYTQIFMRVESSGQ